MPDSSRKLTSDIRTSSIKTENFHGKVRASELAKLATDAVITPGSNCFVPFIKFQNAFGTEMDTDAAPLAPLFINIVFIQLQFPHTKFLSVL